MAAGLEVGLPPPAEPVEEPTGAVAVGDLAVEAPWEEGGGLAWRGELEEGPAEDAGSAIGANG